MTPLMDKWGKFKWGKGDPPKKADFPGLIRGLIGKRTQLFGVTGSDVGLSLSLLPSHCPGHPVPNSLSRDIIRRPTGELHLVQMVRSSAQRSDHWASSQSGYRPKWLQTRGGRSTVIYAPSGHGRHRLGEDPERGRAPAPACLLGHPSRCKVTPSAGRSSPVRQEETRL